MVQQYLDTTITLQHAISKLKTQYNGTEGTAEVVMSHH